MIVHQWHIWRCIMKRQMASADDRRVCVECNTSSDALALLIEFLLEDSCCSCFRFFEIYRPLFCLFLTKCHEVSILIKMYICCLILFDLLFIHDIIAATANKHV